MLTACVSGGRGIPNTVERNPRPNSVGMYSKVPVKRVWPPETASADTRTASFSASNAADSAVCTRALLCSIPWPAAGDVTCTRTASRKTLSNAAHSEKNASAFTAMTATMISTGNAAASSTVI